MLIFKKSIFFLIVLFYVRMSYSFNNDNCIESFIATKPMTNSKWGSICTSTFDITVLPTDLGISSGEFLSSTGECRGLDFRNKQALEYIEFNFEQVRIDCARGNGEYLKALSKIFNCNTDASLIFFSLSQSKYEQIFINERFKWSATYNSPYRVYAEFVKMINSDSSLKLKCQK